MSIPEQEMIMDAIRARRASEMKRVVENRARESVDTHDHDITETLRARGAGVEGGIGPYGTIQENAQITWDIMEIAMRSSSWSRTDPVFRHWVYMTTHKMSRALAGDPDYLDNPLDVEGYSHLLVEHIKSKTGRKS
jgi:hypothetical protein